MAQWSTTLPSFAKDSGISPAPRTGGSQPPVTPALGNQYLLVPLGHLGSHGHTHTWKHTHTHNCIKLIFKAIKKISFICFSFYPILSALIWWLPLHTPSSFWRCLETVALWDTPSQCYLQESAWLPEASLKWTFNLCPQTSDGDRQHSCCLLWSPWDRLPGQGFLYLIKETRFDLRQTLSRLNDVGVVENISAHAYMSFQGMYLLPFLQPGAKHDGLTSFDLHHGCVLNTVLLKNRQNEWN